MRTVCRNLFLVLMAVFLEILSHTNLLERISTEFNGGLRLVLTKEGIWIGTVS